MKFYRRIPCSIKFFSADWEHIQDYVDTRAMWEEQLPEVLPYIRLYKVYGGKEKFKVLLSKECPNEIVAKIEKLYPNWRFE